MGVLYITEYQKYSGSGTPFQAPLEPEQASQKITYTTPVASAAFGKNTYLIRVHTDSICSVVVGTAPVATTTNKRLAANQTEYFAVVPNQKISAITNT